MQVKITHTDIAIVSENRFGVLAYDARGREYTLLDHKGEFVAFDRPTSARRLEGKVRDAGEINADLWLARAPYGTEAWLADGEELRQIEDERLGY